MSYNIKIDSIKNNLSSVLSLTCISESDVKVNLLNSKINSCNDVKTSIFNFLDNVFNDRSVPLGDGINNTRLNAYSDYFQEIKTINNIPTRVNIISYPNGRGIILDGVKVANDGIYLDFNVTTSNNFKIFIQQKQTEYNTFIPAANPSNPTESKNEAFWKIGNNQSTFDSYISQLTTRFTLLKSTFESFKSNTVQFYKFGEEAIQQISLTQSLYKSQEKMTSETKNLYQSLTDIETVLPQIFPKMNIALNAYKSTLLDMDEQNFLFITKLRDKTIYNNSYDAISNNHISTLLSNLTTLKELI